MIDRLMEVCAAKWLIYRETDDPMMKYINAVTVTIHFFYPRMYLDPTFHERFVYNRIDKKDKRYTGNNQTDISC
jgi:hypothetical protein